MRGFVFSLDSIFAVFIFLIILIAVFSFLQYPSSYVPESNAVIVASDIISALDEQGVFDSLDETQIASILNSKLPSNIKMSLKLYIYEDDLDFDETKQVNTDLTENYYQGKWLLIVGNITDIQNYVKVEYKVGFV